MRILYNRNSYNFFPAERRELQLSTCSHWTVLTLTTQLAENKLNCSTSVLQLSLTQFLTSVVVCYWSASAQHLSGKHGAVCTSCSISCSTPALTHFVWGSEGQAVGLPTAAPPTAPMPSMGLPTTKGLQCSQNKPLQRQTTKKAANCWLLAEKLAQEQKGGIFAFAPEKMEANQCLHAL